MTTPIVFPAKMTLVHAHALLIALTELEGQTGYFKSEMFAFYRNFP